MPDNIEAVAAQIPGLQDILKKALIDLISTLQSGAHDGIQFAKDQIPDVLVQYLHYQFWMSTVSIIGAFLMTTCGILLCLKMISVCKKAEDEGTFTAGVVICVASFLLMGVGVATIVHNTTTLIQVSVAPKVYILDKLLIAVGSKSIL